MQRQSIVLLTIFFAILIGVGFNYFNSVKSKQDYLDLRNTRLLVRLGNQITSQVHAVRVVADNQIDTLNSGFSANLITNLRDVIPGVRWIREVIPSRDDRISACAYPSFIAAQDSLQLNVHYVRTVDSLRIRHFVFDIGGLDVLIDRLRNTDQIFHEVLFVRLTDGTVVENPENAHGLLRVDSIPDVNGRVLTLSQMGNGDQVGFLTVGGEEHRLYIHPLKVTDIADANSKFETWAVCGLVDSRDFRNESLAISFITLVILVLLAVLLILCGPLLKLKLADRGDSIRSADVIAMSLSVVFGACVVTILTACVLLKLASTELLDSQLKSLQKTAAGRFVTEVDSVARVLESLTPHLDTTWIAGQKPGGRSVSLFDKAKTQSWLKHPESLWARNYPFFDQFYGVNSRGDQIYKVRIDTSSTHRGNVGDREYFSAVSESRLLSLGGRKLSVQPLISKSTGEFSVTVGTAGGPVKDIAANCIDFRPVSVVNPVLPPGFEFCIIDARGGVLFHSKSERNLQENFLDETGDPDLIRSIMDSRTERCFSSTYWGEESRICVSPVDSLPWFIATLYPIQNTYIVGLQTVSTSLLFFGLYIVPFFLVFLICLISPMRRAAWIWPDESKLTSYIAVSAFNALVAIVLLVVFLLVPDSDSALTLGAILPHMCIVFVYIQFSPQTKNWKPRAWILAGDALLIILFSRLTPLVSSRFALPVTGLAFGGLVASSFLFPFNDRALGAVRKLQSGISRWIDFRRAYVTAVFLFLIMGIVLPGSIFFAAAFEEQMTLYMRENQLQVVHRLENRQALIRQEFRARPPGYSGLFLDRRLSMDSDRYLSFFNATRVDTHAYHVRARKWIDSAFIWPFMPAYDRMSIDLRSVAANPADRSYGWYTDRDSVILGRRRPLDASLDSTKGKLWLVSAVPTIADLSSPWNIYQWLLIVGVISGLAVGLFLIIHFVARDVFLLDMECIPKPEVSVNMKLFESLWPHLGASRKFVLYRLAKDGFVNSNHVGTVSALIRDGLVVRSPEIRIADDGIASYILNETKETQESLAEAVGQSRQSSKPLRIAIFAFLLLLILFLFWTQRQLWTTTLTFISAASVVLPLVFRMFGSLDSTKSQSE